MTATGEFRLDGKGFETGHGRAVLGAVCAWVLTVFFALAASAQETTSDEQYLRIYGLINQADTLSQSGQLEAARAKYQEAYAALRAFRERYPTWSSKVIAHRLNYVASRIAQLEKPVPPATAESPNTNRPGGPVAAGQPALPAGVQFKLLDAGAEPRVALRFRPNPGDTQTVTMTLNMALEMQVGESPAQKIQVPPLRLTLNTSIAGVAPGGEITFQTVVTDVDVLGANGLSAEMSDAIKRAVGVMRGMSYGGKLTDRGFFKTLDTQAEGAAEPQIQQAVDQVRQAMSAMGVQWPEDAVGPGARWQVSQPVKSRGMTYQQSVQAELESVEADRVTINYAVSQKAGPQKVKIPGLPGAAVELLGMTGQGNGKMTLELTRIMPVRADIDTQSGMTMRMSMTDQPQTMAMKTGFKLKIAQP